MRVQRVPFLTSVIISVYKHALLVKIASVREVVLGAPLRVILKQPALRTFASDVDPLVALVHRPKESFFLIPQEELNLLNTSNLLPDAAKSMLVFQLPFEGT
ncbi:hypothetical protein RchiOBHm_Chr1g0328971 [Rosa chinensis]|uniref:Uncharacterized protein n=1 Tax=Rosa chinensis TaxID=74649 RepID=A0A2P6SAY0_ROSCH|nr:hypothetical protein RchiOBHm_Chr1g0328971 [Rosa chinensis]